MKKLLIICTILFSLAAAAQDVDSTRIPQTITMQQKYIVFIERWSTDRTSADFHNLVNQVAQQRDSTNLMKLITVTMPSGFIKERFRDVSFLPERIAAQFNQDMLPIFASQITNPWLMAQVGLLRQQGWDDRDWSVLEEIKWLYLIDPL